MFTNSEPTDVRIDVVRRGSGRVVDSWVEPAQEPNTRHTAKWNGIRPATKKPVRNGTYKFRVGPESGSMESTSNARFKYHRFKFPIRGRHHTVTGSAPRGRATPTRGRTSLPVAARRWWRPAAAASSGRPTTRRPATTW